MPLPVVGAPGPTGAVAVAPAADAGTAPAEAPAVAIGADALPAMIVGAPVPPTITGGWPPDGSCESPQAAHTSAQTALVSVQRARMLDRSYSGELVAMRMKSNPPATIPELSAPGC